MKNDGILLTEGAYQWAYKEFIKYYGEQWVESSLPKKLSIKRIVEESNPPNNGDDMAIFLFDSNIKKNMPIVMAKFPEKKVSMYFLQREEFDRQFAANKELFTLLLMFGRVEYEKVLLEKGGSVLPQIHITDSA